MVRILEDEDKAVKLTRLVHGRMNAQLAEKSEGSESARLLELARDVLFDNLTSEQWDRTLFKGGSFMLARLPEDLPPREEAPDPDELPPILEEDLNALGGQRRLLLELIFVERCTMEETARLFNLGSAESLQGFVQRLLPRWCTPGDPDGFRSVKRRLSQDERSSAHLSLDDMVGRGEGAGSQPPPTMRPVAPTLDEGRDWRQGLAGLVMAAAGLALVGLLVSSLGQVPRIADPRSGLGEKERAGRPTAATPEDGGPVLVEGELLDSDSVVPMAYRHHTGARILFGPACRSRMGRESLFVDRGRTAVTLDAGGLALSTPYFVATVTSGRYLFGMDGERAFLSVYRGEASLRPATGSGDHGVGPMRKALVDATGKVLILDLEGSSDPMAQLRQVASSSTKVRVGAGARLMARARGSRRDDARKGMKQAVGPTDRIGDRRPTAQHRRRRYGEALYRLSF